jgi:uncharacterized protein with HEPN domain
MSEHSPEITLKQILSHSREAVDICRRRTRADLDSDRMFNLALTRLIEIIGESANRVPTSIQKKYPDLPWQQMISARNRLIHGYDSVDFDILWSIVKQDLPNLIQRLEEILKNNLAS